MRNTKEGPLGSEGSDAPALQQLMEVNEEYQKVQEKIKEEAKRSRNDYKQKPELSKSSFKIV